MSAKGAERPRLWIVAGPNGSGKTTLYEEVDIEGFGRSVWIINPDLLSRRIHDLQGLSAAEANVEALNRIEAWLKASVEAYQTVGVETVLSTEKYRPLVHRAKSLGFEIRLIYVLLSDVELNIERIRLRVAKGGHGVAANKVRERSERSLKQLAWFLDQSDWAVVYDNSGASPRLVGRKLYGKVEVDPSAPANLRSALI